MLSARKVSQGPRSWKSQGTDPAVASSPEGFGVIVPAAFSVELPSVEPETGGGIHQVIDVHQELVLGWTVIVYQDSGPVNGALWLTFVDVFRAVEQESNLCQRNDYITNGYQRNPTQCDEQTDPTS